MHCLVYHVPFFTKKYGKPLRFSGQGVEQINDDRKKIHHSKTVKYTKPVLKSFLLQKYAKGVISPRHQD
jgi:hypothetical protein